MTTGDSYLGPKHDGPRRFAEKEPENRTEAERDHDRILYTSAFQRLAGITQIAAPETGSAVHNRLTHTLKVAQIARRLAKRVGLDPDRQETAAAAALAHDLGHPPFGHIAERELNRLAADWGGFEGNAQSFRIINTLAARDPDYWGLNLTRRTLNATLKYPWLRVDGDPKKGRKWGAYEHEKPAFRFAREGFGDSDAPSLEAAIMDWSDDVTYAVHDLDDFFRIGLIPLERLSDPNGDERRRFRESFFTTSEGKSTLREKFTEDGLMEADIDAALDFVFGGAFGDITPYRGSRTDRIELRYRTSALIGRFVQAASIDSGERLEIKQPQRAEVAVLKELAWHFVITDPSLATIQRGQVRVVGELHQIYCDAIDDPDEGWKLFPLAQQELLEVTREDDRRYRVATDFVAGLTEALAYELHHRLTGVSRGSIMDAAARMHPAPTFAMLSRGDLRLALSAPSGAGGGGQAMPDGTKPEPGGWNRFSLEVADLAALVGRTTKGGSSLPERRRHRRGRKADPARRSLGQSSRALRTDPAGRCTVGFHLMRIRRVVRTTKGKQL